MNKTEFLNLLEQRLMMLNDNERADLLSEYEQHIEMKIQSGLSEEEAIADFGEPEELVRELLEAYHLNTEYQRNNQFASKMTYYIKSCANFLSGTFESLCQMDKKELFQLFIRACGMVFFLGILYMFGALFCSFLYSFIVYTLPFGNSIGHIFYGAIEFSLHLIFMAFTIYLIIFFIKRYVLINYQPLEPQPFYQPYPTEPRISMDDVQNYANGAKEHTAAFIAQMRQKAAKSRELRLLDKEGQNSSHFSVPDISLGDICLKILVWCCRVACFFFLLFAACTALGLVVGTAAALVFVIMGYSIIGPFMIILGCALVSVVVTALLFQFVFNIGGVKV